VPGMRVTYFLREKSWQEVRRPRPPGLIHPNGGCCATS
jgi:hypothetical protein